MGACRNSHITLMANRTDYYLVKYSRAYAADDPDRFLAQPTSTDAEWQHFSAPYLQLTLEQRSSADEPLSARFQIKWSPPAVQSNITRQEAAILVRYCNRLFVRFVSDVWVVQEDIDLHSLAAFSASSGRQSGSSTGLKVVYRDSVVGFRYLHPRIIAPGQNPVWLHFSF